MSEEGGIPLRIRCKHGEDLRKSPWRLVPKIGPFPIFCPSHFRRNLSKFHLAFAKFSKICPDFGNRPSGGPKRDDDYVCNIRRRFYEMTVLRRSPKSSLHHGLNLGPPMASQGTPSYDLHNCTPSLCIDTCPFEIWPYV